MIMEDIISLEDLIKSKDGRTIFVVFKKSGNALVSFFTRQITATKTQVRWTESTKS